MTKLTLSKLAKTWVFDVDGTIVKHNGHLSGQDQLLSGVRQFFNKIPQEDVIILLTARKKKYLPALKLFLKKSKIRYNYLLTDLPMGERILINDKKLSGLKTAFAVNVKRDAALNLEIKIDKNL